MLLLVTGSLNLTTFNLNILPSRGLFKQRLTFEILHSEAKLKNKSTGRKCEADRANPLFDEYTYKSSISGLGKADDYWLKLA